MGVPYKDSRLTAEDIDTISQAVAQAVQPATLVRVGALSIGCTLPSLRDSEVELIATMVQAVLVTAARFEVEA